MDATVIELRPRDRTDTVPAPESAASQSPPSAHSTHSAYVEPTILEMTPRARNVSDQRLRELQIQALLIQMTRALDAYGCPSFRTEATMRELSQTLGVHGAYFIMPGLILVGFGDPDTTATETHLVTTHSGYSPMRLNELHKLINKLVDCETGSSTRNLGTVVSELERISKMPDPFPSLPLQLACRSVASSIASVLYFGGNWVDMLAAFVVGLLVALLSIISKWVPNFDKISDVVGAALSAMLAKIVYTMYPQCCFFAVSMAGAIFYLPGLSITMAVYELATGQMVAGTVKFFAAFITLVKVGYGLQLGDRLVWWNDATPPACDSTVHLAFFIPLFFPMVIAQWILLQSTARQWPAMTLSSALGFLVAKLASQYFNFDLSTALAAFIVGMTANLYARWRDRAAMITVVAGVITLVPGGLGVKGVASLLTDDIVSGIAFTTQTLVVALSIVIGILAASMFVPVSKNARKVFLASRPRGHAVYGMDTNVTLNKGTRPFVVRVARKLAALDPDYTNEPVRRSFLHL